MQKNRFYGLFATTLAALSLTLVAKNADAQVREQNFRFASVQVAEHPFSQGGQRCAEILEQKSGGKMKAKLFAGGTKGGDAEAISAL